LEIDLEIKTNEVSRLRKQNQVYQAEIKKFLTINSQLTEDVRNLTSRCDLEEKAFNEFRSKANSDIERLEDELKTTKGVLNEELISKKTLLKESKKAKKETSLAQDRAENQEKKVGGLNDRISALIKEKRRI